MTEQSIREHYFDWMLEKISAEEPPRKKPSYMKLFQHLDSREFIALIGLDENRAAAGVDMRYRYFGNECGYTDHQIANYLDVRPCSILEMMVALSIDLENIMADPDKGCQLGRWFWDMIVSLELDDQYDSRYSRKVVDEKLDRFLHRAYEYNGRGGLFTVENKKRYDMRTIDIWYQSMWHLDEVLEGEE
jgi:hypothetical protein